MVDIYIPRRKLIIKLFSSSSTTVLFSSEKLSRNYQSLTLQHSVNMVDGKQYHLVEPVDSQDVRRNISSDFNTI